MSSRSNPCGGTRRAVGHTRGRRTDARVERDTPRAVFAMSPTPGSDAAMRALDEQVSARVSLARLLGVSIASGGSTTVHASRASPPPPPSLAQWDRLAKLAGDAPASRSRTPPRASPGRIARDVDDALVDADPATLGRLATVPTTTTTASRRRGRPAVPVDSDPARDVIAARMELEDLRREAARQRAENAERLERDARDAAETRAALDDDAARLSAARADLDARESALRAREADVERREAFFPTLANAERALREREDAAADAEDAAREAEDAVAERVADVDRRRRDAARVETEAKRALADVEDERARLEQDARELESRRVAILDELATRERLVAESEAAATASAREKAALDADVARLRAVEADERARVDRLEKLRADVIDAERGLATRTAALAETERESSAAKARLAASTAEAARVESGFEPPRRVVVGTRIVGIGLEPS